MAERLLFSLGAELIKKIASLTANEVTLAWKFQNKLDNLQKSLMMISALVRDASSNNKAQLDSVEVWLQELNGVAFDIDVVLEDFGYETLRYKIENRKRDKLRDLIFPSKNPIVFRQKMAHEIKKVQKSVDELYNRGIKLGLLDQQLAPAVTANTDFYNERLTHPFIDDDSNIVGRENDVLNVVDMLCGDDDKNLSVLAIVGLGGQGKTTLAQLVCKNEKVVKHFDNLIIWICVSEEFVVTTLLNEMVQFFTGKNRQLSNVQAIVNNELGPKLKGKRYLLVLDDVWNEDEDKWRSFKSALLGISGAKGSKVMVTTRHNKVASTMQASSHFLGKLSDKESWTMFEQRAFGHGGAPESDALTKIGREIVKSCLGLPLAIKVIGSLMYSKKTENDWLSVQNNQLWNIEDSTNRVLQTLKLSYDHLSFMLKRCFCYCSIYPKDKVIRKDELIQCWTALGLLQPPSGSDQAMEDLGERHFETLLSMCLLQDTVKDWYGDIESCKMHDIVHDLALTTTQADYSTLKSVALISSKYVNPQPHLRVLVLNDASVKEDSIKKLKHVRYLDIGATYIDHLPSSFTTFYNLHTIKFDGLRSVSIHLKKLINLRHLCVEDIEGSGKCWLTGIGRLTCLQTLPFFGVNREHGCHISELQSLNNLRGDLVIFGLDDVVNYEEAKHAFICEKRNLRRLRLCWGRPYGFSRDYSYSYQDGDNTESVLEGLEPHSSLEGLTIENFKGSNFPQWMMVKTKVLGNLVNLELRNCDKCERIPSLGHLQRLKVVKIISLRNVTEIGLEFYGSSIGSEGMPIFPMLREIVLYDMPKLERWLDAVPQSSVSKTIEFPCLEKLDIEDCPNLKSVPSHFPSLAELRISDIDSLALKELSRMQSSLTSLDLQSCRGSGFQSLLEEFCRRNNTSLTNLRIASCEYLTDIKQCLPSARTVSISECSQLIGLPSLSQVFPVMERFELKNCSEIVAFPDIRSHTCLQELVIWKLKKLTSMHIRYTYMRGPRGELCKSLHKLNLYGCDALVSFPNFRYLRSLRLWYTYRSTEESGPSNLSLPFSSEFNCLQDLDFGGLPVLKSLPEQIQHLTALTSLKLRYLASLESLPKWLGNLISLQALDIEWCEKLKYLPEQIQHLTALTSLNLRYLDSLKSLPEGLGNLINLRYLEIKGCPLLEKGFTNRFSSEWRKISHIPTIKFNDREISSVDDIIKAIKLGY